MIRKNHNLDVALRKIIEYGLKHVVSKAATAVFTTTTSFYETISALEKKGLLKQFAVARHNDELYVFDMPDKDALELLEKIGSTKYPIENSELIKKIAKILIDLSDVRYYDFDNKDYIKSNAEITNLAALNAELSRHRTMKLLADRRIARFHPTDDDVMKAYTLIKMQEIIEK